MAKRTPRPPVGFDVAGIDAVRAILGDMSHAKLDRARFRDDDPAPVYTLLGRPIARRAELEAWYRRELARPPAPPKERARPARPLTVADVEAMDAAALDALAKRIRELPACTRDDG